MQPISVHSLRRSLVSSFAMHKPMLGSRLKSICSFLGRARTRWIRVKFVSMGWRVMVIGSRIEETCTLIRQGADFALRRDVGGRWKLDLHRVPVDHVAKRVRISGIVVAEGLIDVEALGPDLPAL